MSGDHRNETRKLANKEMWEKIKPYGKNYGI